MKYSKEAFEKLDKLSSRLGIECWMKVKDEDKINSIIEEIITLYQQHK